MTKQLAIPLLVMAELLAGIEPSHATQTWCAEVQRSVPDGFLNLRGGPSTNHPVLARLQGGEYIEIDTAICAERFSGNWTAGGTICAEAGSSWAFVERAPASEGGNVADGSTSDMSKPFRAAISMIEIRAVTPANRG